MLIDTNIFLGFANDDRRIPTRILRKMENQPEEVSISAISFWEVVMLAQRGVITIDSMDPGDWMKQQVADAGFREVGLSSEIAVLSRTLTFEHNDPADRFIAATAFYLQAPLATTDARLRRLPWLQIA